MSAEQPDPELEEAVRGCAHPSARPEFRSELRQRFLAVERKRRPWGILIPVLAAAAAIAFLVLYGTRKATEWSVLEGAGTVLVDGERIPAAETARLARAIAGAAEIETGDGELVLRQGDRALFDLAPHTRVRTSPAWSVLAGRLRGRTGPAFAGERMRVAADLFDVDIVGTAFAIDYEEQGTCICCLHGEVRVSSPRLPKEGMPIEPGRMCFVFREEGRKALWEGAPEAHATPLQKLEETARKIWPRP